MKIKKQHFKTILGGFSAGLINGMLGAGGGMLVVPILKKLNLNRQEAHANSVAVIMPLSLFSAILYVSAKKVALYDILPFLPSGLIGALLGTITLKKMPDKYLKTVFSGFMIWAGFRLILR